MHATRLLLAAMLALGLFSISTTTAHADKGSEKVTTSAPKHQYFRHIMFRESPYAPYRGIYSLDSQNNPDFAHYEFDYDRQGRITEISYQLNDTLIRDNQVWDSFIWFAPKVRIEYQPGKEIHTYYNKDNQQISAHGNVFRAIYTLDDQNRRIALNFYDASGNASESEWNVHRYEWRHDTDKVYEKRFNLADEQQPLRPVLNFYEVELEYDRDGKLAFMRNLGLQGVPTNNDSGAGIDRITYDQNGNFVRWQVYDKDGSAIEGNNPMVHLGEHLYDQHGNKVGMRGFDRFGNRIPFSWGIFEHVRVFNGLGHMKEHRMYNSQGDLDRHLLIEYSADNSEITWFKSLNDARNLAASPMLGGAAALKFSYQGEGEVQREFFNADMSPFQRAASGSSE